MEELPAVSVQLKRFADPSSNVVEAPGETKEVWIKIWKVWLVPADILYPLLKLTVDGPPEADTNGVLVAVETIAPLESFTRRLLARVALVREIYTGKALSVISPFASAATVTLPISTDPLVSVEVEEFNVNTGFEPTNLIFGVVTEKVVVFWVLPLEYLAYIRAM